MDGNLSVQLTRARINCLVDVGLLNDVRSISNLKLRDAISPHHKDLSDRK